MKEMFLADGRRLAWREAGTGRPLVFLHGWSMSSAVFAEVLRDFSADFRVLAPDLRGHGASDGAADYGFAGFAGDLAEWMSLLDLEEAAVAGWSLGGEVLLELYNAVRPRLERIILVSTTPRFAAGADWPAGLPEGQVRAMARDLKRGYQKSMGAFFDLQFAGEELPPGRYRQIVDFAVRAGRLPEPAVALASLETLRLGDLRNRCQGIDCPALVVQGGLDRITLPAAGPWLAQHLPAGRLAAMPAAGHAPFLSRPEEVFRLWREFLC